MIELCTSGDWCTEIMLSRPSARASSVCGVLVTHNPDPTSVRRALFAALSQLESLVVVDNASDEPSWSAIRRALEDTNSESFAGQAKRTFIRNETNLGLAKALNQGIGVARGSGCRFVLFLDHDSVLQDGAVTSLVTAYSGLSGQFKIGALTAYNVEVAALPLDEFLSGYFERRGMFRQDPIREVMLLSNSGLFVDISIFDQVGEFDESYFIDAIDFEFVLRLQSLGYRLFIDYESRIVHTRGTYAEVGIGGWKWGFHQPAVWREFYVARDMLRVANTYVRSVPLMGFFLYLMLTGEAFRCLFFYDRRLERLKLLAAGTLEAFRLRPLE